MNRPGFLWDFLNWNLNPFAAKGQFRVRVVKEFRYRRLVFELPLILCVTHVASVMAKAVDHIDRDLGQYRCRGGSRIQVDRGEGWADAVFMPIPDHGARNAFASSSGRTFKLIHEGA